MSRPPAGERIRRVFAMIPWVVAQGSATVEEIAQQFGTTPATVRRDLTLAMCAEPRSSLDRVAMWIEDDGSVHAQPAAFFDRPRRLTAAQGFAVLAAIDTLRQVAGASGTALDSLAVKLRDALGASSTDVAVVLDDPPLLGVVRDAITRGERLHIEYYAAWRDEVTERDIDPVRVMAFGNAWQLDAWCYLAGGPRRFRVDRIRAARFAGVRVERHELGDNGPVEVFEASDDVTRLVLDLSADQQWITERYPHEVIERRADGATRVALSAVGTTWIERLLLRLGPDARVIEPAEMVDLPRDAARRILTRYRDS